MQITGISFDQFRTIVAAYDGILVNDYRILSPNRFRVSLRARSSYEPRARRSWSGRRGSYVCWHTYRDIFSDVYRLNANARIATGLAVYRSEKNFLDTYPATADKNIGSAFQPAYMPDLCDCTD